MASVSGRIAKNTLMLYFRMILTMLVSLYTVRVVLNTLGTVDYGIYCVVGGIVVMFSFVSGAMASASQRFFSFELGKGDIPQLKKTFSMSIAIYVLIALLVLVLSETLGLWFLQNKLVIPADRVDAAFWMYQFSILSFLFTIIVTPYNASIIAHEEMSIYAYVSIIEVMLKLAIVYFLVLFQFDKLQLYAVLMFCVSFVIASIYVIICRVKFIECRFTFYWDNVLFRNISSYVGWSFFGALAGVSKSQGVNILLNIFFGPIVNTTRGIAYQVNGAINSFAQNFSMAVRPQIIKLYATGDTVSMMNLVFQSSKFTYYLLFILSMPILLETPFILSMWLGVLPENVVLFTRLVIIDALIESVSLSLMCASQATGRVKLYQGIVGGILLLNLPVSYFALKYGMGPAVTMYISISLSVLALFFRLFLLHFQIGISIKRFVLKVIMPVVFVSIVSYTVPVIMIHKISFGFVRFILISIIALVSSIFVIFTIGINKNEREYFVRSIQGKFKK